MNATCKRCGAQFRRTKNTRFCADECRFDSRVTRGYCWLWTGSLNRAGYGQFCIGGANQLAHRVSYERYRGRIPEGMTLDHLCRVRRCVNPAHLEPVTRAVNTMRGVAPTVLLFWRNECKHGHEFTPENTYYFLGGARRSCRTCRRASAQRRKERSVNGYEREVTP